MLHKVALNLAQEEIIPIFSNDCESRYTLYFLKLSFKPLV
jgi:hypothetical protein